METGSKKVERHEHTGSQCKASDKGKVCSEESCRHDHHVSRHVEISCTPIAGKPNHYDCVHETH
jgi:hypothetical protein